MLLKSIALIYECGGAIFCKLLYLIMGLFHQMVGILAFIGCHVIRSHLHMKLSKQNFSIFCMVQKFFFLKAKFYFFLI